MGFELSWGGGAGNVPTAGLGTVPAPPQHFLAAAVAAQVRAHDLRRETRIGPPAEPPGHGPGRLCGGAGDSGEKAAKPPTANGR